MTTTTNSIDLVAMEAAQAFAEREALRLRLANGCRDAEVARRIEAARLRDEVTERLRAL